MGDDLKGLILSQNPNLSTLQKLLGPADSHDTLIEYKYNLGPGPFFGGPKAIVVWYATDEKLMRVYLAGDSLL
ncbi:hypothetical protein BH09VER1_BH09VER1_46020 [soil metagenome]